MPAITHDLMTDDLIDPCPPKPKRLDVMVYSGPQSLQMHLKIRAWLRRRGLLAA